MFSPNFQSKKNWRPHAAKIEKTNKLRAKHARYFTILRWIFNKIRDFYVISIWGPHQRPLVGGPLVGGLGPRPPRAPPGTGLGPGPVGILWGSGPPGPFVPCPPLCTPLHSPRKFSAAGILRFKMKNLLVRKITRHTKISWKFALSRCLDFLFCIEK